MKAARRGRAGALLVILALIALVVGACGGDDDGGGSGGADGAFLESMIPHHESAVEMARIARRRARHPEVAELAQAIITTQTNEIREIRTLHERIFGGPVLPNEDANAALGLSAEESGMAHMDSAAALKRADPFDRAFIDAMIPHHQGAIRMARAVLDQTEYAGVRKLANAIVGAQSREIRRMNKWRRAWYGAPSPAGGVPEKGEAMGEEHDGH